MTTFDKLVNGQVFRFIGGTTSFVRVDEWTIRMMGGRQDIPIRGENGYPPRDKVTTP